MLLYRIVNSPLMRDENDTAVIAPWLSADEAGLLAGRGWVIGSEVGSPGGWIFRRRGWVASGIRLVKV